MNYTQEQKDQWVTWLSRYGAENFLNAFLKNVEGAQSICKYCKRKILVDVLVGGGVADWATDDGDFGCDASPETNDECAGNHMPVKGKGY